MFISSMDAANELVGITANAGSYSQTAIVVPSAPHTWFVGCTDSPCAIVIPEGFWTDMAA